jgi:hypothetical protein
VNGVAPDKSFARESDLAVALGRLVLVVAVVFPGLLWWGYARHGGTGIISATIAVLVCLIASSLALVITVWAGPQGGVGGLLLSLFCRTGLPLIAGLLLTQLNHALARAGVFGMILICYLVTLAAETVLSVRLIGAMAKRSKAV